MTEFSSETMPSREWSEILKVLEEIKNELWFLAYMKNEVIKTRIVEEITCWSLGWGFSIWNLESDTLRI